MRVSGSEATMFLNGLVTNDMKTLGENQWMPAVFPTVQGRLIGAVRMVRVRDGFLIDTDAASYEAVLKTISRFTLAGDFRVTDLTDRSALMTVQGKRAAEVVESVVGMSVSNMARNGAAELEWQGGRLTILRATHTAEDGFDVLSEPNQAAALKQGFGDAGVQPVSEEAFEMLRLEAGIARYGRDMDETNVVVETNLDDAVSYTKGCYVGQEIIVRIKHRGHVAKKLTGLKFDTNSPVEPGAILKSNDNKEAGRVTSTAFSPKLGSTIGLGYVRYEYLAAGTNVSLENGIAATIHELPFVRGSWYEN